MEQSGEFGSICRRVTIVLAIKFHLGIFRIIHLPIVERKRNGLGSSGGGMGGGAVIQKACTTGAFAAAGISTIQ